MINLVTGINQVFVTLRERSELTNPDYLVEIIFRDKTSEAKVLKTADSSSSTDRLNELTIEVVATEAAEDLDNAKVYLRGGDYQYKIFESDDGTSDITGKKLLETGIINFNTDLNSQEYEPNGTETIYKG